jgi:hypothetical protein
MSEIFTLKNNPSLKPLVRQIRDDFIEMTGLILANIFLVYFAPSIVRDSLFPIFLVLFWHSKKNYFWFAYLFLLLNAPAGLFYGLNYADPFRLPMYKIGGSFSFRFLDLFVILALFKGFVKGSPKRIWVNKPIKIIFFYLLLITIPISFILNVQIATFANNFRAVFYYSAFVSMLMLIRKKEEMILFGYLLLPYMLLIFANQLMSILLNFRLKSLLISNYRQVRIVNSITGESRLYISGTLVVFFSLIFAMLINGNRKYSLFRFQSEIIILISSLIILLTATRVWITIYAVSIFVFFLISDRTISKVSRFSTFTIIGIIIAISTQMVNIDYIERNIFNRYFPTIRALAYGDLDKTDTLTDRFNNDIPKVLAGLEQSPILGVGLSNLYRKHYSNDLGFLNTMLLFGIVGTILFFIFLINFYLKMLRFYYVAKRENFEHAKFVPPLLAAWAGIIVGYAFTWDFFSFYPYKIVFISVLLAFSEVIVWDYKKVKNDNL